MARATDIKPYIIEFESFVTGHRVYKAVWSPVIGESLNTQMELDSVHDKYAVKCLEKAHVIAVFVLKFGRNNRRRRGNGMEVPVQIQTEETKDIFIKSRIHN